MAGMRRYKRLLAIGGTAAVLLSNMASASLLAYANEQSVEYAEVEASTAAAEADSGQTGPYQGEGQSEPDAQNETAVYYDEPEIAVYSEDDAHEVPADDAASGDDSPEIEEGALEADEQNAETGELDADAGASAGIDGANDDNTGDHNTAEAGSSDEQIDAEDADAAESGENATGGEIDVNDEASHDEITDEEATDDLTAEDAEALEGDALLAEEELEELEEFGEEGDPVSYDAEIDGITVHVEVPYDAFSEDVDLVASRIEDEQDLMEVTDTLDASDVTYDGYLALDIHFEDENGAEVEPDGEVRVAFDLAEDVLPEEADTQTLAVQHFDTSSGDVEVVTVADTTDDESTGEVTVSGNTETLASSSDVAVAVAAEFDVASFSTFTITWTYSGWWSNDSKTLSIMCVDENGSELPATVAPGPISISSGTAVDLTSDNYDLALDGYSLVGVSAYVNNTSYDHVTSVKASYSSGWGWSGWTYRLYSGTTEVYSGSTAPSLKLIYGTGEIRISYTLDASDAEGSAPQSHAAEENSYIVLPDCEATRNGYTFLGWTENQFVIKGASSDLQTIYQPGDRYKVTGSQTFHAAWSQNSMTGRTDFYVRLDSVIPANDAKVDKAEYSKGIYIADNVKDRKWIYDTGGTLAEETDRDYVKNSVTENLYQVPTNAQIADKINAAGLALKVKCVNNRLIVTTAGNGFAEGEELYVHWYTQKYQSTDTSDSTNEGTINSWHIDGVLLAKDKVTIKYVENAKGTVTGMPSGYQVTKGTTVKAGSSISATGTVMEPSLKGYEFLGWNTKADGSGTFYMSGSDIKLDENTTLYAMWKDPTADIVDTGVDLGNAGHVTMMFLAMGVMTAAGLGLIARRKLF